jgi:hypothetical protein
MREVVHSLECIDSKTFTKVGHERCYQIFVLLNSASVIENFSARSDTATVPPNRAPCLCDLRESLSRVGHHLATVECICESKA